MKINKMNKKGAIGWKYIIGVIIAILAFFIILVWIGGSPIEWILRTTTCEQSVAKRSAEISILKPGQMVGIPLMCKTEEIIIDSTDEKEIKRQLADALYDCWNMLGQGELNFFSRDLSKKTYCTICSTIEFSEKIQERIKQIQGLDQYLIETKIRGKDFSYAQFLTTDEAPQINKETNSIIDTTKKYAVTYAMAERSNAAGWVGTGVGGIVGIIVGAKIAGPKGAIIGATLVAGGGNIVANTLQNFIEGTNSDYYVAMDLVPLGAQSLKDFGCTSIESIP